MAIVTQTYTINGKSFTKTYSDEGRYVVRDGIAYDEANDPTEFGRVYEEGDYIYDPDEEVDDEELLNILMGETK